MSQSDTEWMVTQSLITDQCAITHGERMIAQLVFTFCASSLVFQTCSFTSKGKQTETKVCVNPIPQSCFLDTSAAVAGADQMRYLTQDEAIVIDVELMTSPGFSLDQLMELAGLSCAAAVADMYPLLPSQDSGGRRSVAVLAGPGNNGGDGLVAARHLHHFGYDVSVIYPKPSSKFDNLVAQIQALGISIYTNFVSAGIYTKPMTSWVVLDGLFGFSFRGLPREPLATVLRELAELSNKLHVFSIDIPSGWNVENGPPHDEETFVRSVGLISLTAPKKCAKYFKQRHYLGGRFVPPGIADKYQLKLLKYEGDKQYILIHDAKEKN